MIGVKQLSTQQGSFSLRDISFDIPEGGYGVLMGPSGSGKTTLLDCLAGLRPVTAGRVFVASQDVTDWSPERRSIGYVPQNSGLFPGMKARDQIAFGMRVRRRTSSVTSSRIDERVGELAEALAIENILDRMPADLSGGEQSRVAIARALAFPPKALLMDEPLAAVDLETRQRINQCIKTHAIDQKITILHATHRRDEIDADDPVVIHFSTSQDGSPNS